MSSHLRPFSRVFVVVLALTLVLSTAGVSSAQESAPAGGAPPAGETAAIAELPLAAPQAIPGGGPGFSNLPSFGFTAFPNQDTPYSFSTLLLRNPDTVPHDYQGVLSLPDGATINRFVVFYKDNDATQNLTATLVRMALDGNTFSNMATLTSPGALANNRYMAATAISVSTVDLQSYAYFVDVNLPATLNVGLFSIRIDYQYAAYVPALAK